MALELTEEERERRAAHESGHVAMALVTGHRVRGVTLNPPVTDIDFARSPNEGDIERALEALAILYAGSVVDGFPHLEGVARVLGDESGDEGHAVSVAMRTVSSDHVQDLLQAGRERARTLAARPDFVRLHEQITAALLERGRLNGTEISKLTRGRHGIET